MDITGHIDLIWVLDCGNHAVRASAPLRTTSAVLVCSPSEHMLCNVCFVVVFFFLLLECYMLLIIIFCIEKQH